MVPLDVGDLGAWNYLDTASTCPHLYEQKKSTPFNMAAIISSSVSPMCEVNSSKVRGLKPGSLHSFFLRVGLGLRHQVEGLMLDR